MADAGALIPRIPSGEIPALFARPDLVLLGIDDGKGLLPALAEARQRFSRMSIGLLEPGREVEGWFGSRTGMFLLLRSGIVLRSIHWKDAPGAGLDRFLEGAEGIDATAELQKAQAWLGEAPPPDAAAFRRAVRGSYRQPCDFAQVELELESAGRCRHLESSSGIQGGSSDEREGSWRHLDGHLVELRWVRAGSDEEVGMSRHRTSRDLEWRQWARIAFRGGKGVEIRFVGGAAPSLEPGTEAPYLRVG